MSCLKVRKLPNWVFHDAKDFDLSTQLGTDAYKETTPKFHRDGLYFDRISGMCWLEVNNKAFLYNLDTFKYESKVEDYELLTAREEKALKEVYNCTPDQDLKKVIFNRLTEHRFMVGMRNSRRDAMLWWIQSKKIILAWTLNN